MPPISASRCCHGTWAPSTPKKPLLLADRVGAHTAPICLTQSASEHSIHLHLHSKARIYGTASNGMLDRVVARAQRTIHSRTAHRHPMLIHHPPLLALAPQWQADEGPQQVWPALSYKPCRHRAHAYQGAYSPLRTATL
jgi:hypothetical protein